LSSIPSDIKDIHIVQAVTIRWYNACAHYAVTLARGLQGIGCRVTVAGGKGTPALDHARDNSIPVLALPMPPAYNIAGHKRLIDKVKRFSEKEDVSLVNVHHGVDHTAWLLGLRGTGIPLIRTSGNQYPPKVHPVSRLIMKRTGAVIATSKLVREYYLNGFGIPEFNVPVINGGVDDIFYSPDKREASLRGELGIPDNAYVFGIIGRFSPVKGHRYFIEAAGIIAQKHPQAWFLIAGSEAQMKLSDIQGMVQDAGISDRTRITGRHKNSRRLISTIDAGVVASIGSETICRIAMEYMAMNVPVIATNTNSVPEIIRDGQSGIIVPAGNSSAIVTAMEKFLEDSNYALDLGNGGRQIVERDYSLNSFARKTLDIYRRHGLNAG